eukprot:COSAG04_NODE_14893_length_551_cov_0.637168_1_plen_102_part_00
MGWLSLYLCVGALGAGAVSVDVGAALHAHAHNLAVLQHESTPHRAAAGWMRRSAHRDERDAGGGILLEDHLLDLVKNHNSLVKIGLKPTGIRLIWSQTLLT